MTTFYVIQDTSGNTYTNKAFPQWVAGNDFGKGFGFINFPDARKVAKDLHEKTGRPYEISIVIMTPVETIQK